MYAYWPRERGLNVRPFVHLFKVRGIQLFFWATDSIVATQLKTMTEIQ